MKKFSLLLLTMALLLLCSAQASNIDKAVLTAEPWVNPFGTQLVFGANSKGKMVAPTGDVTNFDYEVSGDSVTYTYKFWGGFYDRCDLRVWRGGRYSVPMPRRGGETHQRKLLSG